MKASLDTNAIIHFYRADSKEILLDFFDEGVFIYEQIRKAELENHAKDLLEEIDSDISVDRIILYTDEKLKKEGVFRIFQNKVNENRNLYWAGDLGEVYAISLAQTIGAYSLVTDDTKQGGPYMSLLQFEDDIMPFTFADILILRYLCGDENAEKTVEIFDTINLASNLNWSFKSQLTKFIKRFWSDPYRKEDLEWMACLVKERNIKVRSKIIELRNLV